MMLHHAMGLWLCTGLLLLRQPLVVDSWTILTYRKPGARTILLPYKDTSSSSSSHLYSLPQRYSTTTIHRKSWLLSSRRQSRLYNSEPIVSSSSSKSGASNSTSSLSSSSAAAEAAAATTTVLPFMATAQSIGVVTNPKTSSAATVAASTVVVNKSSNEIDITKSSVITSLNNIDIPLADDDTTTTTTSTTTIQSESIMDTIIPPLNIAIETTNILDDIEVQQQQSVIVDNYIDIHYMKIAIELAQLDGGEHGPRSAYPNPTVGAILVSTDSSTGTSTIIGRGRSDYRTEAVRACMEDAGYVIASLSEWVVTYPIRVADNDIISTTTNPAIVAATSTSTSTTSNPRVRQNITLYTTLEPSTRRRGTATPPVTNLIRVANIQRVVIGCPSPVPEKAMLGATAIHNAGIDVTMIQDPTIRDACQSIIRDFSISSNCKLQRMARKHFQLFGRPLGFLHCSVIHSDNIEAFRRNGNAFGSTTSTTTVGSLSYRNFGTYELAPPPDNIWATTETDIDNDDDYDSDVVTGGSSKRIDDEFVMIDFEDEDSTDDANTLLSSNQRSDSSPMMPWYNQVDAVVGTFPRSGNGPPNDDSIMARLNGLKWLATHGNQLSAGVERILVLDATELRHLPLTNDDPNLPKGVDIESFWRSTDRKPVRLLLRRGVHEAARAAAVAASVAAEAAAVAAEIAANAIELGDATKAATAAIECANSALTSKRYIEQELETTQVIRRKLEDLGVIIETLPGGEPIDVMEHLGTRNGLYSVVWRAGCWGERGVRAILAGAFQWVSAHIAVPADGGRFWQLMMAENAVQGACGPQSKVKVFADQDDISMEYCNTDDDCVLSVDGKPIRHVRLDCRVALVDEQRPREFDIAKTQTMNHKVLLEQAPWFL